MRLLITAGPTREPIDAVRYISNRSSGRIGVAIALAALEAGHEATLLLGPGADAKDLPSACTPRRFETAADLSRLIEAEFPRHDALVMAAAVADYRPSQTAAGKLPREASGGLTLRLEPTPDLVAAAVRAKRPGQVVVAFALEEPERLEARAAEKLRRKGADAIVANPLATMDAADVTPVWLTAAGEREAPGAMSKAQFGAWLVMKLEGLAAATRDA